MKLFDLIRLRYHFHVAGMLYIDTLYSDGKPEKHRNAIKAAETIAFKRYYKIDQELRSKYRLQKDQVLVDHLQDFRGYRIVRFIFRLLGMGHYV